MAITLLEPSVILAKVAAGPSRRFTKTPFERPPSGSELRTSLLAFSCHREPLDALLSITSGLSLTEVWNECSDFE